MKKIFREILIVVLILSAMFTSVSECFADNTVLHGLYVKPEELNDNFSKYISSIYLANTASGWTLYVNGYSQGTKSGNPISFSYKPNANTNYVLTFDVSSRTASGYYQNTVEDTVISVFSFAIENADQTVVFQSDPDAEPVTKTATKNAQGYYDFGEFSFIYKEKPVSFTLKINANTNKAVISREGKDYSYTLTGSGKYETVYCEALVPAQELDLDYMETKLEKQTYSSAKTILYSEDDINDALSNYRYTLVNNKTGKTTTVPLRTRITYWSRNEDSGTAIGDGTYTESSKSVQVVCQWDEDKCSSIRSKYGDANRPFAVYGTSTEYNYVAKSSTETKKTLYKNVTWPSSNWSGEVSLATAYSALDSSYGVVRYRTAPANWGTYSDWEEYTGAKERLCSNSDSCQYETQTRYAYYSRSWSSWSDYTYSSCSAETGAVECKSADRYAQRTRSWGSWSGYIYTGTSSLGCSAVGSALISNECERESAQLYSKKTANYSDWSSWSSWGTSSCTSSSTKNCESKTVYAWRSMGSWSDWNTTTLNVACNTAYTSSGGDKDISLQTTDCKTETQYKKRTRSITNYTYSDFGEYKTAKYDWTAGCTSRTGTNSECGIDRYSYSDWGSKSTSKYGSYQDGCMSVYGSNSLCGVLRYDTTFGEYKDSKYGSYTSDCKSKTVNSTCNTYYTDGSKCGYEYGSWSSWSGYTTTSCSTSTTKDCGSRTEYRSKTCSTYYTNGSKCGYSAWSQTGSSCVASCSASTGTTTKTECSGVYIASVGACKKGQYKKTTYSRTALSCAAAGCSSWGSWGSWGTTSCTSVANQKQCDTRTTYRYRTRTATAQSCAAAGCKTYNTKTQYSCPTSKTTVYKSCTLYECPSRRTAVYNSCTSYSCPHYRTTHFSDWSSWSDWTTTACSSGDLVDCDSKVVNYKRTRSWSDWSGYNYSYGATNSTIDYKSQNQSRYQTRSLIWGDWTDYKYSSCTASETVQCDSATRYRIRYLGSWSSWSGYTLMSCTSSDTTDCDKKTLYAKRTMGEWGTTLSGTTGNGIYGLTTCTETETKKCVSQKQIRERFKTAGTFGAWSGKYRSLSDIPYDSNYFYQYQYNNGVLEESTEKGTSTTVGTGSMYVKTIEGGKQIVETAVVATKSYSVPERMTNSEISSFTTTLGTEAAESSYVNSLISSSSETDYYGSKYISWANWEGNNGQNIAAGNAAVSRFLNEKRFIPYIFITQHHRATNAKFLIDGYNDESISSSMVIRTATDDTQTGIRLYPDEQPFCEVYPNDSSCRTTPVNPPSEPDDPVVTPEPDFCTQYPMSARCSASSLDTAVIYYNYLDPLENYTQYTLPSNWVGLNSLINEIKASDLSSYKIKVTLRNSDINAMREWLDANPDKVGTGEMIRAFSYIFETDDAQIRELIQNGGVNP